MRVLSIINLGSLNPYPLEIYKHLEKNHDITCDCSLAKFFLPDEYDYDIIHLHWPSETTSVLVNTDFLIGTTNFHPELYSISSALKKWKKKAKIVYTRHNEKPHEGQNEFFSLLEDLITKYADAVIHLGEYSKESYLQQGSNAAQINSVIPHHMYNCYHNDSTKEKSRQYLNIDKKTFVVLIFGAVRNEGEKEFAEQVFDHIKIKNKLLLSPRWFAEDYTKYGRLYNLIRTNIDKLKGIFQSNRFRLGDFRTSITPDKVQHHFHAADVVLIPRLDTLNSGVIPLAYSFKKAVVGPRLGNLTEVLEGAGNSTFEANDHVAAAGIINDLIVQGNAGEFGLENHRYGQDHLHLDQISRKHYELYRQLTT